MNVEERMESMSKIKRLMVGAALLVFQANAVHAAESEAPRPLDVAGSYEAFMAFHDEYHGNLPDQEELGSNHRDIFLPIQEEFHRLFKGVLEAEPFPVLASGALQEVYRTAYTASFYMPDELSARLMKSVSKELQQRPSAPQSDGQHPPMEQHEILSYYSLINARLFDEARNFADHMGIDESQRRESLYGIRPGGGEALNLLRPGGSDSNVQFEVESLNLERGPMVIAAVDSGCHFSKEAMEYLDENHHKIHDAGVPVHWVTRQSNTGRALSRIHDWNQDAEHIKMRIAWRESDWPETIAFHTTPRFYFIEDGELESVMNGWVGEAPHEEFFKLLRRL
ncbi:Spy/CpxP family protein refolding chaperone [Natronospira proteinivora]|uniref:Spy/CpxP family protein refolding chaperone n=1 Tax=Natronospira proteinivora TaxID=1807133 RepID=A0ABT1G839_9GAMM|nr:hypothetical protein [Natronospira proteinivora]MCP1727481.1 Spy/CpxP family protein refolding chaperone [Natronospira proteinivora]